MPKPVGRYIYWSDRLVREVVEDNGVRLTPGIKTAVKLGLGGSGVDVAGRDREQTPFEVAETIKKRLRAHIATDFDAPGPLQLVQGKSRVVVSEFQRWGADPEHTFGQRTAMIHAQTTTRAGRRVDLCLFGGLKNLRGFTVPEDDPVGGWASSAAPAIEELIALRGAPLSARTRSRFPDDIEALAVDTLKVATTQGIYADPADHRGRPETRAFTVIGFEASDFVATIYKDVTLTPGRWDLRTEPEIDGVSRILIGAPLWLRMARPETLKSYYGPNRVVLSDLPSLAPSTQPAITPLGQQATRQGNPMHG
ncbi:hypothetical protein GCM10010372_43990 [Streptomyces tauricus]|uniref:hypothetical protein n=1 Tax=Streptomyces tauricus TaxID=68274 RepID=UPI0016783E25|nr:hypothetical protein [Streptomyces tauricus]GHA39017.1 hypothetical protein GCM10010372_43990 [Streptomyces tauricus]